jgi:hypothetical protein
MLQGTASKRPYILSHSRLLPLLTSMRTNLPVDGAMTRLCDPGLVQLSVAAAKLADLPLRPSDFSPLIA